MRVGAALTKRGWFDAVRDSLFAVPGRSARTLGLPRGRTALGVAMLGICFHVEAVPVADVDGLQMGIDPVSESRLNALAVEFDAPGFCTVQIKGVDYAVFITPFGR